MANRWFDPPQSCLCCYARSVVHSPLSKHASEFGLELGWDGHSFQQLFFKGCSLLWWLLRQEISPLEGADIFTAGVTRD